jgi:hypothetical protein
MGRLNISKVSMNVDPLLSLMFYPNPNRMRRKPLLKFILLAPAGCFVQRGMNALTAA